MPYRLASAAALPGVGEATATTSACSDAILKAAAWMSASNLEPMIPTFTFPLLGIIFLASTTGLILVSRRAAEACRTKMKGRVRRHGYKQHCTHSSHRQSEYPPPALFAQSFQTSISEVEQT